MKKLTFLFSVLLTAFVTTFAQKSGADHKHGSPHGGTVKSAGTEFHIEASFKDGMLMVYLLDAEEQAMKNTGAKATAIIQTADGKTSNITLIPSGKEGFMYTVDKSKKYNKAIVTILIGEKTASASFDLNVAVKHVEEAGHKHQH
jgi:hypothetical protein